MKLAIQTGRKGLFLNYIKRGAGDADEQLAIDTALEKDDWKIYYKYLDSVYQQIVNHPASTVKERREAEIRLEVNRLYFDYDIEPESMSDYYEDWRNQEINHYIEAKTALMNAELYEEAEEYYLTETQKKQLQEEVKVALYRIKNNVPTNEGNKKAEFLELSQNVKYIGYLCAIVLFVQIFVRDFERKNMTQLGLQPYSRKELFWSKVCSMLLISSALLFVCFLSSAILANVLYQETINDCILILEENVVQMNFYGYILLMYVLGEVEVMIAATFIIWFGIYGFSSAFTIVIGCVLFFGKFALALAANRYHIFALRFVPLVWFDWSQFLRGDILVAGTTVGLSVIGTIVIGGLLLISANRQYMRMDF